MKIIALILGSISAGASMKLFLFPFNVPSGGAAGISVILHNFFHASFGSTLFLLNVVLLLLSYRIYGFKFIIRTILTVSLMSSTVDLIPSLTLFRYEWLSACIGALIFGLSMSLILYSGSTSGGMDILAKFIETRWKTRFGTNLFFINSTILVIAGFLLGWQVTLYGICAQLLSNTTINFMGNLREKMAKRSIKTTLLRGSVKKFS